jgi:hypothetical protein
VDPGEQCDDGNTVDADACRNDCTDPTCGDGIVDSGIGEECDLGTQNNDLGLCGTDCKRNPRYYCANPVAAYVRKAGFKHTVGASTPFDTWQMKGDIIVALPAIDPANENVTIALTQATDPDAPSSFQKTKTKDDAAPFTLKGVGKWRFYDRKGNTGWTKGFLRARDAHVKYLLQGKSADIGLDPMKVRIRQSLVIGNRCWEAVLTCTVKSSGKLLRCRSTGLPF